MEGVLKSWAVPKGPSLNPADKRLAVMVEDHPLSYGAFEGTIPEGQYGAGEVVIWDRGSFTPESGSIPSGRLEFFLNGARLKGGFTLLRLKGKKEEWLLIKKRDEYADPSYSLRTVLPSS